MEFIGTLQKSRFWWVKVGHRGITAIGLCRNLIKKPRLDKPKIVGSILRTQIKTQSFLIRFLHWGLTFWGLVEFSGDYRHDPCTKPQSGLQLLLRMGYEQSLESIV